MQKNSTAVKELGDVGNDIQVYDADGCSAGHQRSHKVEVRTPTRPAASRRSTIPNCRYIRFKGKYAYVSAYVGPVAMDPDAQKRLRLHGLRHLPDRRPGDR